MNPTAVLAAILICLPALTLASKRSSWLIDYLIAVVAFNRGLRRIVDYSNGEFDPLSPISLTPLVVGALAAYIVLTEFQSGRSRFGETTRKVLKWYLTACALAMVTGVFYNRLGALFAFSEYLAPVGMLGFAAIYADQPRVITRWALSAAGIGVGVAAYGIYQYYTIPPWDAFWVRSVGFEGYLGTLEPTKMTLFSTLNSRGPAGTFFAGSLILVLLRAEKLGALRIPAAALIGVAMLLTRVRSSLIMVVLACVALPITTRGKGLGQLAVVAVVAAVFGESLLGFLPQPEQLADRYGTLANIQEDGSFRGRIRLLGYAIQQSATAPLGFGFGSHGLAGRVSGATQHGVMDSTGYLEILSTFGWLGGALIVAVLRQLWMSSTVAWKNDPKDPDAALFRAWFVAGMVVLFSSNWLDSASYFWVLAGYVLGRHDLILREQRGFLTATLTPGVGRPFIAR